MPDLNTHNWIKTLEVSHELALKVDSLAERIRETKMTTSQKVSFILDSKKYQDYNSKEYQEKLYWVTNIENNFQEEEKDEKEPRFDFSDLESAYDVVEEEKTWFKKIIEKIKNIFWKNKNTKKISFDDL